MKRIIRCEDLLKSISDYVEGDLDPMICAQLEEHLSHCENCQVVVNTTKKTIELYHTANCDPSLPEDVETRLFLRLNLADFTKERK